MFRPIALFLLSFCIMKGQGGASSAVEGLVKMHDVWGPKASTPNTSLAVKESRRPGQVIQFRLIAGGVPKEGTYSIIAWPVTQKGPSEVLKGVTLDASGMAICAGKIGTCGSADKPDDPIDLTLRPVPGEPVRLGLVSADGATKVFTKLVPLPLDGEDRGCRVDATLLTPKGELVLIEGSGFPANSEVTLDTESGNERHSEKRKTDSSGLFTSAILPFRQGVAGGSTRVTLKAGKCAPMVSVSWGKE